MYALSERFEVRLPSEQLRELRQEAQRRKVSVAQLIREAIQLLLEEDLKRRQQAAMDLFQAEAPIEDWDVMEQQIGAARSKGLG